MSKAFKCNHCKKLFEGIPYDPQSYEKYFHIGTTLVNFAIPGSFCKECWLGIWNNLKEVKELVGLSTRSEKMESALKEIIKQCEEHSQFIDPNRYSTICSCSWHEYTSVIAKGALE